MKILLYGNMALVDALRGAGHEVLTVGIMEQGHDLIPEHPLPWSRVWTWAESQGFVPDLFFHSDDGNLPALLGVERIPCPSIFYSIDTFCNPWHVPYAYAFDYTLVAQQGFVALFENEGHPTHWFPLFCRHVAVEETEEEWLRRRDIPMAFVGSLRPRNIPQRLPFLEQVNALHPVSIQQGDFVPIFSRARIVLNQTAVQEVNFRCFEAMGCGSALLHDSEHHGFTELFTAGEDVLPAYPYGNARAAATVARFWLARPEKLARLALRGADLVARQHSAPVRASRVREIALDLLAQQRHQQRLASLDRRGRFLRAAYGMIAAELPDEFAPQRDLYLRLSLRWTETTSNPQC